MAASPAYLWRGRCGGGLTSCEAFARQHRLHHIPLGAPNKGAPLPGRASFAEEFHRGGPWGGPPAKEGGPLNTESFSQRALKQFSWQEERGGFVRRPGKEPGVGSASGASGSPLAAVAAAAATAAAAAAAVRRAAAASPLGPLMLKAQLAAKTAFDAVTKPTEDIHIATLSELFADAQLERMRQFMMEDDEGREVLKQKPLLDDRFINYEALRRLPKDTLGYALVRFLDSNALHAGHRQPVRFVEDEELAYVLTRYRQLHDVMHAAFEMGISIESEVALKLIEFHQTGLPVSAAAAAADGLAAAFAPAAAAAVADALPPPAARAAAAALASPFAPAAAAAALAAAAAAFVAAHALATALAAAAADVTTRPPHNAAAAAAAATQAAAIAAAAIAATAAAATMTLLAAAFGPFAAPLLRVHLAAAAARSAHAGPASAAVAAAAHSLTASPNSLLQLLLPQQPAAAAAEPGSATAAAAGTAAAAESAAAAAAGTAAAAASDEPVVLYPRYTLLNEMLPWADAAGKAMRRRVYCLFVEEWFDKPLKAFQIHCGITPVPTRFAAYCA
ncbi:hypothetical protein Emed_005515 [Eimeria media]